MSNKRLFSFKKYNPKVQHVIDKKANNFGNEENLLKVTLLGCCGLEMPHSNGQQDKKIICLI